ncbi:MAG: alcohol dehydrogenase catalytic domain-containing protein [Bacteroidetes bacterium]|nr:alcohol dehydrogenase catalytic domain-containing protein [Bacteroidota bacterium]
MKIAVMTSPGKIEFQEKEIPSFSDTEVLVKIKAVGLCTWEQKYFRGIPYSYPFIGGHEISGIVETVGKNVAQNIKKGDHVVVASLTRCGECYFCRRGLDNLCENTGSGFDSNPGELWGPGGFSEYFVARAYEVYKISSDVDIATGTLAEPLACVLRSIDRSRIEFGDTAVVLGGGVMGMIHLLLVKNRGASVIVSEPDEARRKKALSFGADYAVDPLTTDLSLFVKKHTQGRGAESVFFTAGGKRAIEDGIKCLVQNGTMVIYGGTGSDDILTFDPKLFHYDEIYLTGVTKHTKDTFRRAAELISNGGLPLNELITEEYPFETIEKAFDRAGAMDTFRVIVKL